MMINFLTLDADAGEALSPRELVTGLKKLVTKLDAVGSVQVR